MFGGREVRKAMAVESRTEEGAGLAGKT